MAVRPLPERSVDHCIPGREVVLRFRSRLTGNVWGTSVVCPANWSRKRLLDYVRRCHPKETVRIEEWKPVGHPEDRWETRLWIVSPYEM